MLQSNTPDFQEMRVSDPFPELFQPLIDAEKISGPDFMIRLELLIMLAAIQSLPIPYAIRENWKRFYP